jgi:hypothetical protein
MGFPLKTIERKMNNNKRIMIRAKPRACAAFDAQGAFTFKLLIAD